MTSQTIKTNELMQPGYVWFECEAWGLDDNTTGKTGWHVEYMPLNAAYEHDVEITPAMAAAVREHYAAERAADKAAAELETVAAEPTEWRSARGLTLNEEMEREDTQY